MSTEPKSVQYVIVLSFDVPMGPAALNDVIKAIQEAKLPHVVGPIHLAMEDMAERVLDVFGGVNDDGNCPTAIQKDKG